MAGPGLPVERLRSYLKDLKPGSRALLIGEIERGLLRGDDIPGAELILQELRRTVREPGRPLQRIGNLARLFFQPLEPFLVDDAAEHEHPGRIARDSLEPIWRWISRDLLPAEAAAVSEKVGEALTADDTHKAEQLAHHFQDRVILRMQEAVDAAEGSEKALMRLSVQVGTPQALDDVRAISRMLKARAVTEAIGGQLPLHVPNLTGEQIDKIKALLDSPICRQPDMLLSGLIITMGRLAARWQLIRLAVRAAGGNAARVGETPYAIAVTVVLSEAERLVRELKHTIKGGNGAAINALLKNIHDAARGIRTELDLGTGTPWAKRLAALRADVSELLKNQFESMPSRVRRLLRQRPADASGSALSQSEIEDVERQVALVAACRQYAGELAISEMTQRAFGELQHYLESATPLLIESLRDADDADRNFRRSQVDAAIRLCARVFGAEHAAVLQKAAELAEKTERKAAAGA